MAMPSSDFEPSVRTHRAEPRPDEKSVRMDGTIFALCAIAKSRLRSELRNLCKSFEGIKPEENETLSLKLSDGI